MGVTNNRSFPTYEETQRMLRAPYERGVAAKGYSGLEVGQPLEFRPYPNDPTYVEIKASRPDGLIVFTEVWDVVEGYDRDGVRE